MMDGAFDHARRLLAGAGSTLVLTGAGVSAESGVPTFRGSGGLWKSVRAEDLATPEAFARDPVLVWAWYGHRREEMRACEPNAAHVALAAWQHRDARVRIATQNVDGLHSRALDAEPRDRILEIHGTLFAVRCTRCPQRASHDGEIDATSIDTLPRCTECGGLQRPDVVWFGEPLERRVIERAFRWAEVADVCLVIGTSALVHPAAGLPSITSDTGGVIIEVNPEETPLSDAAEVSLRGTAATIVPAILPG